MLAISSAPELRPEPFEVSSVAQAQKWLVLKFGGTSVSRRDRWDTIGRMAVERGAANGARVLVVVSAVSGVTNELQAICDGDDASSRVAALIARHRAFCEELGLDPDAALGERFAELQGLLDDPRAGERPLPWQAEVLAQGELLSSTLGVAYLRSQGLDFGWCDARDWLQAGQVPNRSEWALRLSVQPSREVEPGFAARFSAHPSPMVLTQGFIARHADGGTAVFGRGGSDTSAACFGALLGAVAVEIWTDVPGMFSANPRVVPDARLLTRLDYAEAQEIATTGAKVLHPRSIGPCRRAGVPMAILDTSRPWLPGTRIDGSSSAVPGVKAISRRDGVVLVSMESIGMWQEVGFLSDIFALFKHHGLSVDLIGSSETNVTISLDPSDNLVTSNVLEALATDLARVCRVKVIAPCTGITLVGRGMRSLLHRLSDVWATFGRERVHLISQSSNDLNLTFVIDEADAEGLLPLLHAELIRSGAMPVLDPGVFGPSWREIEFGRRQRREPWWRSAGQGSGEQRQRAGQHLRDAGHHGGGPLLLCDQGQPASSHSAHGRQRGPGSGVRVAGRAGARFRDPAGFAGGTRAVHPQFRAAPGIRGRAGDGGDRHAGQYRGPAALARGVPRPDHLAASGSGARGWPSRKGPHRRPCTPEPRPACRPWTGRRGP